MPVTVADQMGRTEVVRGDKLTSAIREIRICVALKLVEERFTIAPIPVGYGNGELRLHVMIVKTVRIRMCAAGAAVEEPGTIAKGIPMSARPIAAMVTPIAMLPITVVRIAATKHAHQTTVRAAPTLSIRQPATSSATGPEAVMIVHVQRQRQHVAREGVAKRPAAGPVAAV